MSAPPAVDAVATDDLKGPAAAFGLAAALAILFSAALACAQDVYKPLNAYMVSLTGDSWSAQGVADIVAFFGLGYLFTFRNVRISVWRLAALLAAASVVAGGGLALWFVLV